MFEPRTPALRRRFESGYQLKHQVWVADDGVFMVIPPAEAMTLAPSLRQVDADGVARDYQRCGSRQWRALCRMLPAQLLAPIRAAMVSVHGVDLIDAITPSVVAA